LICSSIGEESLLELTTSRRASLAQSIHLRQPTTGNLLRVRFAASLFRGVQISGHLKPNANIALGHGDSAWCSGDGQRVDLDAENASLSASSAMVLTPGALTRHSKSFACAMRSAWFGVAATREQFRFG